MEDSHGVENSGRYQLRFVWVGDFLQCKGISAKVNINGSLEHWKGSYMTINFGGLSMSTSFFLDAFATAFCATPKCEKFMRKKGNCNI